MEDYKLRKLDEMEKRFLQMETDMENTKNEEVLGLIHDMLLFANDEIVKNNVDKELSDIFRWVVEEVNRPDFLDHVIKNIELVSERITMNEKDENRLDFILPSLTVLIKLARCIYISIRFASSSSEGKYGILSKLYIEGDSVLPGYYNWKKNLKNCLLRILHPFLLIQAFSDLHIARTQSYGLLRTDNADQIGSDVSDNFLYVDKAYGDRLSEDRGEVTLDANDIYSLQSIGIDHFCEEDGSFSLPLGLKGWIGKKDNRYIVSFAGTRMTDLGSVYADMEQILGPSLMYICAVGIVNLFARMDSEAQVLVLGHSLGGGLTQFAVAACNSDNVTGYGFNSAGLSTYSITHILSKLSSDGIDSVDNLNIRHFLTMGDCVSKFGALIGSVTTIPGSIGLGHSRDDLRHALSVEI